MVIALRGKFADACGGNWHIAVSLPTRLRGARQLSSALVPQLRIARLNAFENGHLLALAINPDAAGSAMLADA